MTVEAYAFPGFDLDEVGSDGTSIFVRRAGRGPPVLLLHGFPETGLMWRAVAPVLAQDFAVTVADLPGYGRSGIPADGAGAKPMSKRALANALVRCMRDADHKLFAIVGHDRGARVAYRAALDHPGSISKAVVLDVVPTHDAWDLADARFALAFWPFSLLAQPAPLPERLVSAVPDAVVDNALAVWGTPAETFPAWLRAEYVEALRDPARVHAICEEYRAAASIDRDHDKADLQAGRRMRCPLLALWSDRGALSQWYRDVGGPLGLWRRWADDVRGQAIAGGHFFPEENPVETAALIRAFLLE